MHNDTLPGVPEHVHYFYNTFYQAGGHSNMRMTVQSTPNLIEKDMSFTNNIFYTYGGTGLGMGEGGIVRGSGREIDGVDWDGNNFYSEVPNAFENYFSWNILYDTADIAHRFSKLSDIIAAGQMPATWTGNTEGNPSFNCVDPANITCFKPSASIIQPSNLQQVPANFPESNRLNSRNKIGAFE